MLLENLKIFTEDKSNLAIAVAILCVVVFGTYSLMPASENNINTKDIASEKAVNNDELSAIKSFSNNLDDITLKLNKIEQELIKPAVNIEPIQAQISSLAKETEELNSSSQNMLHEAINNATSDLKAKLSSIEQELSALKKEQLSASFVKEENLPFKVLHIDNIQGNNVATVRYNNTYFPLTEGEHLAGWKVIKSEFDSQKLELINEKGEHVLVALNNSKSSRGA